MVDPLAGSGDEVVAMRLAWHTFARQHLTNSDPVMSAWTSYGRVSRSPRRPPIDDGGGRSNASLTGGEGRTVRSPRS